MCYALTKSTIVVYDMWMNYEDFTRNRKTNAINAVNGIASEYVRRLDDDPSHHCYREKENSARSSISQVTKDSNVVRVILIATDLVNSIYKENEIFQPSRLCGL